MQAELNQGGAWERLCAERDPFVLSGLMWAWLEQLREPIFSDRDVEALTRDPADPRSVLDALQPVRRRGDASDGHASPPPTHVSV